MKRLIKRLDIDQFLIFFLLAVTINQMGHYLATMQPAGFGFIGYLQAAAIDLAIWRSSWWYRKYTGKKQKRWALLGVAIFSLVSAWYNRGFYAMQMPSLPQWQPWLMGAILPAGVALLSFLYGQKDESKFSTRKRENDAREQEYDEYPIPPHVDLLICDKCHRTFAWPGDYANRRAAQNAMNAHKCDGNKHGKEGE